VLRDPPFSRIDLVSCRNLLIFLQRSAQEKVLQTFHYALRPQGYLFLGSSETTGQSDWFRSFNAEHHVYRPTEDAPSGPQLPMMSMDADLPEAEGDVLDEDASSLDEISRAHSDLKNLVDSTDVATVFLDEGLQIQRFTPPVKAFFRIRENDVGRPITELTHDLDYDRLRADAQQVLDELTPIAREVQSTNGDWYLVRVRPYRTVENVIEGVVFTFVNVTDLKETEQRLREEKEYVQSIIDTVREGLVVLDTDLRVLSANAWFYDTFGGAPSDVEGRPFFEVSEGQWDIPRLREALQDVLPEGNGFEGLEVTHAFDRGGERTLLLNARRLTVDLSPPILGGELLSDALGWLKSQMKELHDFTVVIEGESTRSLGEEVRLLVFQIVRELLFNARKHAGVSEATVRVEEPDETDLDDAEAGDDVNGLPPLVVHVTDDGKGFDPDDVDDTATGGFGLRRARERLDLMGGHLTVESAPGEGTHATIYAPPVPAGGGGWLTTKNGLCQLRRGRQKATLHRLGDRRPPSGVEKRRPAVGTLGPAGAAFTARPFASTLLTRPAHNDRRPLR
jgi:PAS domain S-box-containing protein